MTDKEDPTEALEEEIHEAFLNESMLETVYPHDEEPLEIFVPAYWDDAAPGLGRWLEAHDERVRAEQREKDALLAEDTYKGWDKSNLSYEDAAAWSEADAIAAAIRSFTPVEETKQTPLEKLADAVWLDEFDPMRNDDD